MLMLRRCLTWLRATWVVRVLPLDQNILLHQIVGYAILGYTLVHTTAHVFNFGREKNKKRGVGRWLGEAELSVRRLHLPSFHCDKEITAVSLICSPFL